MPYKFNESRRHNFPKAGYRVTNWPEYDAALVRRGGLTVWFSEDAVAAWHAPASGRRGGQPIYSATAIETGLALRLVFHQSLRGTEGLLRSIADVLDIDIAIPDHTTLSRRGSGLAILPKTIGREAGIPKLRSSFHRGPQQFRTRLRRHSAIGILQRSKSMDAWAGSAVRAIIVGAWLKLRSIGTRPSLTDDFKLGTLPNQRTEARIGCNVLIVSRTCRRNTMLCPR